MEIVRCSKGHFYDSEENATCPMCAAEAARNKNPIGNNILEDGIIPTEYFGQTGNSHAVDNTPSPTMPVDPNGGKVQSYQPTVSAGLQDTQSNDNGGMGAFPKTMPLTPPTFLSEEGATTFDPVVGWLVCIKGATKGTDYRIHSQNNYIGRSAKDGHFHSRGFPHQRGEFRHHRLRQRGSHLLLWPLFRPQYRAGKWEARSQRRENRSLRRSDDWYDEAVICAALRRSV